MKDEQQVNFYIKKTKKISFKRVKLDHCVWDWEHGHISWKEELQWFWIFPGGCCQRWGTAWKELEVIYSSDSRMKASHPEEQGRSWSSVLLSPVSLDLPLIWLYTWALTNLPRSWGGRGAFGGVWLRAAGSNVLPGTSPNSSPTGTGCSFSVLPLLFAWAHALPFQPFNHFFQAKKDIFCLFFLAFPRPCTVWSPVGPCRHSKLLIPLRAGAKCSVQTNSGELQSTWRTKDPDVAARSRDLKRCLPQPPKQHEL